MTREETLECIKVMQHYADGGEVDCCIAGDWISASTPNWDWRLRDFRINKTNKIKLNAWLVDGVLQWHREDRMVIGANHSKRVPSEDKWVEVEE